MLHSVSFTIYQNADRRIGFPSHTPDVPYFDKVTPEMIAHNVDSFAEIMKIVQIFILDNLIRKILTNSSACCLVHGDMKFDNILRPKQRSGRANLKIIDWELSGWGDPAWDVGGIIGSYMFVWLDFLDLKKGSDIQDWIRNAKIPFPYVRDIVSYFWKIYSENVSRLLGKSSMFPHNLISIQCAGCFLLQRAFSDVFFIYHLSTRGMCYLLVAQKLIKEPEHVAKLLCI